MFANCKAQKLFARNLTSNEEELNDFDIRLRTQNGSTYEQTLFAEFEKEGVSFLQHGYDH
jgi:hypothetical protein